MHARQVSRAAGPLLVRSNAHSPVIDFAWMKSLRLVLASHPRKPPAATGDHDPVLTVDLGGAQDHESESAGRQEMRRSQARVQVVGDVHQALAACMALGEERARPSLELRSTIEAPAAMTDRPVRGRWRSTRADRRLCDWTSSGGRTRTPNNRARTCRVADYTTPERATASVTAPDQAHRQPAPPPPGRTPNPQPAARPPKTPLARSTERLARARPVSRSPTPCWRNRRCVRSRPPGSATRPCRACSRCSASVRGRARRSPSDPRPPPRRAPISSREGRRR